MADNCEFWESGELVFIYETFSENAVYYKCRAIVSNKRHSYETEVYYQFYYDEKIIRINFGGEEYRYNETDLTHYYCTSYYKRCCKAICTNLVKLRNY